MTTNDVKQYAALQQAFEYFNRKLFADELSECFITLHRKRNARGFHWSDAYHGPNDTILNEIALNPAVFDRSDLDILSTLVHEMCHQWQAEYGKPSRNGYHNKEFANKMKSVGLKPTHNGKLDGKETGQNMTHIILENGYFDVAAKELLADGNIISWRSHDFPTKSSKNTKIMYQCPECGSKVWGKPNLHIACEDCECNFV